LIKGGLIDDGKRKHDKNKREQTGTPKGRKVRGWQGNCWKFLGIRTGSENFPKTPWTQAVRKNVTGYSDY